MGKTSSNTIQFYGAMWCGDCRRAKQFFNKHKIKFQFHDTEKEKGAIEFVEKINNGMRSIPTIIFPDGNVLVEPSNNELVEKLKISNKIQISQD